MPACIAFLIGIRDQAAFSGYARAAVQDMEYGPVVPVTCHCAPDGHRDLGGPVVPNLTSSTRPTGAVTSPPGKSPSYSRLRSGRRAGRCVNDSPHPGLTVTT